MYEKQKEEMKKAADRKAKREEKRKSLPWGNESNLDIADSMFNALGLSRQHQQPDSLAKNRLYVDGPKIKHKRKPKAAPLRRQAFNRLKASCKEFVFLRAKRRNHNRCEVGMACGGFGDIEVWYHIFPQAKGNAIKYDERNILGSCSICNAGEYYNRKYGMNDRYALRHQDILGKTLFDELKSLQGRRQISTAELNLMADRFQKMIDDKVWEQKK